MKNQQQEKGGRQAGTQKKMNWICNLHILSPRKVCIPNKRGQKRGRAEPLTVCGAAFCLLCHARALCASQGGPSTEGLFTVHLLLAAKVVPNVKVGQNFSPWAFLAASLWSWRCCKYSAAEHRVRQPVTNEGGITLGACSEAWAQARRGISPQAL